MEPLLACRQVYAALSLALALFVPAIDDQCAVQQPISNPVAVMAPSVILAALGLRSCRAQ
jgi:hypothetical protein